MWVIFDIVIQSINGGRFGDTVYVSFQFVS